MAAKAFFLMRLNDHVQYLKKMESTLKGKCNFQGTTHSECKLGQWLHGEGANEVATLTNSHAKTVFESLFEPHERFHVISKQALDKQHAGDNEGAKMAMTEMYGLSQMLTQKLLTLDTLV
jgi:hypothetical protein